MIVKSQAPLRIDFAGAWTDVVFVYEPFGGATLNAAINRHVRGQLRCGKDAPGGEGMAVFYETDAPAGAGLGTSACLNVVWLSLINGQPITTEQQRQEIAESSYRIEKVLGIIGGKQDQYAAAFGGINLFEFTKDKVSVHPVHLNQKQVQEIQSLLVLCYTGASRLSSRIHENVWGRFGVGNRDVIEALLQMRDSAYECKEVLEGGDWERFGQILRMQHECAKRLDASTTNETVESLFDLVREDIVGGKCCGAGGGGCILFCAKDERNRNAAREKISKAGFELIDFAFDFEGLKVEVHA